MNLTNELLTRIATGLQRQAVQSPSRWAIKYRIMQQRPWSFDDFPWTREMHDADVELLVGQKAAQMGFTEMLLNRTFYNIDILQHSVLYVLPTDGDASNFSTSRFDPALESSEHLQGLFSDVKNVGHKRAGSSSLFVRGSRSKSKLKSIPVNDIMFDELEEMAQENVTLAEERISGQAERSIWKISTPSLEDKGINKSYKSSTQEHYFFRCEACGRLTELVFPDCLEITAKDTTDKALLNSFIKCKECGAKIHHESKRELFSKGTWVPGYSDRIARGFYINQLYSIRLEPWKIAELYLRSLHDPSDEQEFYNSKLGLTHEVRGARLTESQIEESIGQYTNGGTRTGFITIGIDVGNWLHYEVDRYTMSQSLSTDLSVSTKCQVLEIGKVQHFEQLDTIIKKHRANCVIIDNQPETRKARELANRFPGLVYLCTYGQGLSGKTINLHEEDYHITVDRTTWLDTSQTRFKRGTIKIPLDTPEEYKLQVREPVRVYKKDGNGNPYGLYASAKADHFAHARNYAEIALQVGMRAIKTQSMETPI